MFLLIFGVISAASAGPATESYKGQYCTDPRTMNKHAAYTEWADAYSCTRHRCQPGGRNLAIYTVGCKRVEAPESAIECEEVVEDTNMQFPFCCTRLRCLVVVRGEVWTRVLGQPWEALPAAPWSHMYKMKKPPPGSEGTFLPKTPDQGPIYELTDGENEAGDKVLRAKKTGDGADCNDAVPRASAPRAIAPRPDIVIALSTSPDKDAKALMDADLGVDRHMTRLRKTGSSSFFEEDKERSDPEALETEDNGAPDKLQQADGSEESRFDGNAFGATQKPVNKDHEQHQGWTEIPQNQWNEHDPGMESDNKEVQVTLGHEGEFQPPRPKPSNLQALVDAIGSRMKDIESVVQRMSAKVHDKPQEDENRLPEEDPPHKRHKTEKEKAKRPGPDDNYKRFSIRNHGSKYLHGTDTTTDQPLFVDDNAAPGYFSDASNGMLRRINGPKEPVQTYMAPVETRRKPTSEVLEEDSQKKHKKHKKKKGKHHKKHHGKKKFNRVSSSESEKNVVSLEDSSNVLNS